MLTVKIRTLLLCALMLVSAIANAWIGGVTTQKFIGHGWDLLKATPEAAIAHADEFDRSGLDGITVCLYGKRPDGSKFGLTTIMLDAPWEYRLLEPRLGALRKFKEHPGLKESFLMFWLAPQKRLAWDDDASWSRFAGNLRVLAKLGAAAGMKGYFVDGEDYPKSRQFFYDMKNDGLDYDRTCKLARRRGAEVFGALFAEHPDATLLSFWFLSFNQSYASQRNPSASVRRSGDLWPAFINGILDVMPDTATFVDGDEHAYNYKSADKDFYVKSLNQRHSLGLLDPKNRPKYLARLSIGFGIYLDMCKKPEDMAWLACNIAQAAEVSTEYVWIYGERNNWVGWNKVGEKTWEQEIPGLADVLFSIKDPDGFMKRKLAEMRTAGKAVNEFKNMKDGFSTWKKDSQKTVFELDAGIWRVSKGEGSVLAGLSAKEGEFYATSVAFRGKDVKANVHWRRKGAFDWNKPEIPMFFGPPDENGWRHAAAAALVPTDVDELVIQCDCKADGDSMAELTAFSAIRLRPGKGMQMMGNIVSNRVHRVPNWGSKPTQPLGGIANLAATML